MATQILVIFLIRTREPFWRTRAHPVLLISSLGALAVAIALPFVGLGRWLAFTPPSLLVLATLAGIVVAYLASAELMKRWAMRAPAADVVG
jgi:Mg2+-importing ATPase